MANNKKYNKTTTKVEPVDTVIADTVEETKTEIIEADKEDKKTPSPKKEIKEDAKSSGNLREGVVYNCMKLNVRKGPSKDTAVLHTIASGSKVFVKETGDAEWFKIPGQGYVMKKFISLK